MINSTDIFEEKLKELKREQVRLRTAISAEKEEKTRGLLLEQMVDCLEQQSAMYGKIASVATGITDAMKDKLAFLAMDNSLLREALTTTSDALAVSGEELMKRIGAEGVQEAMAAMAETRVRMYEAILAEIEHRRKEESARVAEPDEKKKANLNAIDKEYRDYCAMLQKWKMLMQ